MTTARPDFERRAIARTGLEPFDLRLTQWLARHSIALLRVGIAIVFIWFGAIKYVPGWSPAEALVAQTFDRMFFGLLGPEAARIVTATMEVVIGLGLLSGRFLRLTLLLLAMQMVGTLMPLVLFPTQTFRAFPFAPTLEGQYILKNVVLIAGAMVIGATVRGGNLRSTD